MTGDITNGRVIVWSKVDRPARMLVEYATTAAFRDAQRMIGPAALEDADLTARLELSNLPPDQQIFYQVLLQDLHDINVVSEPVSGTFRTPSALHEGQPRSVSFVFSGDEAGQGWGINLDWGGYRMYETMRRLAPDFFIHSGDQIYADGVLQPEVPLSDGSVWRNVVTEAKSHVAITLEDFRGNFAYNLMDANKQRFALEVPFLVQWDDHETRNNWYPGQIIGIDAYAQERSASLLAARANRAMFEYNPYRISPANADRVYRSLSYGPLLDVFLLDERSYRGPNSANLQPTLDATSAFLGTEQLQWLKRALRYSSAIWKVIASDMPLSLHVPDGNPDVPPGTWEAWANGDDGVPRGRELEIADLLAFIHANDIKNIVWVTADVHYASAIYYDPGRAQFTTFKPFWEFVAGPLNAGTFGPNPIDATFGPEVKFQSVPAGMPANRPPTEGLQFFGYATIDGTTRVLTVSLRDLHNSVLYTVDIPPEGA